MNSDLTCIFHEEEKDILQEIMNIAFGQASAELAEVIDIFVILSVPEIQILTGAQLPTYLCNELKPAVTVHIIEQSFFGKFSGQALLVFPTGAEKELLSLFDQNNELKNLGVDLDTMEMETLLEIGNILIGACIGKIAELLADLVTYEPPHLTSKNLILEGCESPVPSDSCAISIRTTFSFEQQQVNGYLFLITKQESIDWLKSALMAFIEAYE
jgi:chemotaxis protein CheC